MTGRYWTDDGDELQANIDHWRDSYPEDEDEYTDDQILGILQREHVLRRRQQLLTRAQRWWLAVLGVLVGLSQVAQGVAAAAEMLK